jgi:hypothetical protein
MGSSPNSSPKEDKTAWEQLNPFLKVALALSALLICYISPMGMFIEK